MSFLDMPSPPLCGIRRAQPERRGRFRARFRAWRLRPRCLAGVGGQGARLRHLRWSGFLHFVRAGYAGAAQAKGGDPRLARFRPTRPQLTRFARARRLRPRNNRRSCPRFLWFCGLPGGLAGWIQYAMRGRLSSRQYRGAGRRCPGHARAGSRGRRAPAVRAAGSVASDGLVARGPWLGLLDERTLSVSVIAKASEYHENCRADDDELRGPARPGLGNNGDGQGFRQGFRSNRNGRRFENEVIG
jgi:hypothetical protein